MQKVQTTRTETITVYRAFDGTVWDTETEALDHEYQYCENLYNSMQGATYPANEISHLPFPADNMISIYKDFNDQIYEKLSPDASALNWSEINTAALAQINYEADIDTLLESHTAKELCDQMAPILEKYNLHKIYFYVLADAPRGVEAAKIRNDWATALKNTKDASDINSILRWSFSDKDICELAKLHKANKFRKKIEYMLTDANFHTESGDFAEKQYNAYIKKEV